MGEAEHFPAAARRFAEELPNPPSPRADPQEPLTRGLFALRRGRGES